MTVTRFGEAGFGRVGRGKARQAVQESLERLEDEAHELFLEELRRLDHRDPEDEGLDWATELGQYRRSDGGDPLGKGYPGRSLREDGESHRDAWLRVLRHDPCSYCGARPSMTVDHIEPKLHRTPETNAWTNLAGACMACNGNKSATPLLFWLWGRSRQRFAYDEARERRAA